MLSIHFYKEGSLTGKLVHIFGHTEFVHCALQIDSKHIIETDFGGRVKMDHIYKPPDMLLFYGTTSEQESNLLNKFNKIMHAKYDNTAILGFLTHLIKQNPDRYTCVELVCELLESVGFKFKQKNMKPDQLYNELIHQSSGGSRWSIQLLNTQSYLQG